jgi:hypothetical protein
VYSTRLFHQYRRPVASFAVLGDTERDWRPQSFSQEVLGSRLDFSFSIAKLVDYKYREEELLASKNPFAVVVQAHLAAQATKATTSQRQRQRRKYNLTTMLYVRGFSEQEVIDLYRFIDWVLKLPPKLEAAFRNELETYEGVKNMPYISTIERMGEARGEAKGEARGEAKGKVDLISLLLEHQVGSISAETVEELKKLPLDRLDRLALELREFTSLEDLTAWVDRNNTQSV